MLILFLMKKNQSVKHQFGNVIQKFLFVVFLWESDSMHLFGFTVPEIAHHWSLSLLFPDYVDKLIFCWPNLECFDWYLHSNIGFGEDFLRGESEMEVVVDCYN